MNFRLPILQMVLSSKNGEIGWVFPSELKHDVQEFAFLVPIPIGYHNDYRPRYESVNNAIVNTSYYFPTEMDGRYLEIEGRVKADDLFSQTTESTITFRTRELSVEFSINPYHWKSLYRLEGIQRYRLYRYMSEHKVPILNDCLLLPLVLKNKEIGILNDLASTNSGVFVGYTPFFGDFDSDSFSRRILI